VENHVVVADASNNHIQVCSGVLPEQMGRKEVAVDGELFFVRYYWHLYRFCISKDAKEGRILHLSRVFLSMERKEGFAVAFTWDGISLSEMT